MTSVVREASITSTPLRVERLLDLVSGPSVGGIGLFVGTVRDLNDGAEVSSLDYTMHPRAETALTRCAEATAARHDVLAIAVQHRIGHLEIGDLAVVVAVGAVHREPALEACRHLIDTLKLDVPIWKEEHFSSGSTHWIGLPDEPAAVEGR